MTFYNKTFKKLLWFVFTYFKQLQKAKILYTLRKFDLNAITRFSSLAVFYCSLSKK